MDEPSYSIKSVAERTGLSPHVIRVWERRHRAVTPWRTESGRRLYSEREVARLDLLRRLTESGHGIGSLVRFSEEKLNGLLAADSTVPLARDTATETEEGLLTGALAAVRMMDESSLERVLEKGELAFGAQGVLRRLVGPLATEIGSLWRDGEITAAHEHFATAVIRLILRRGARQFATSMTAPEIVVATPAGQIHELGALMVASSAANLGWRVLYLGAGLGAAEIAGAVRLRKARALALSVVYPEDDAELTMEFTRLRELLPDTPIIVGGRATGGYGDALKRIRAQVVDEISGLGDILDNLRRRQA